MNDKANEEGQAENGKPASIVQNLIRSLTGEGHGGESVSAMLNVKMDVEIVIGRARLPLAKLIGMSKGAVIELDRLIGDPVDVVVNGRVIAHGELVGNGEEGIGVKLTDIIQEIVASAS